MRADDQDWGGQVVTDYERKSLISVLPGAAFHLVCLYADEIYHWINIFIHSFKFTTLNGGCYTRTAKVSENPFT